MSFQSLLSHSLSFCCSPLTSPSPFFSLKSWNSANSLRMNNFKQYFYGKSIPPWKIFWTFVLCCKSIQFPPGNYLLRITLCWKKCIKNVALATYTLNSDIFLRLKYTFFLCILHTAQHQLYWITDAHQWTPEATDAPVLLWMWLSSLPEWRKGRLSKKPMEPNSGNLSGPANLNFSCILIDKGRVVVLTPQCKLVKVRRRWTFWWYSCGQSKWHLLKI